MDIHMWLCGRLVQCACYVLVPDTILTGVNLWLLLQPYKPLTFHYSLLLFFISVLLTGFRWFIVSIVIFLFVYCYNRYMAYMLEQYYLSFTTLSTAGVPIWPPLTVLLSLSVSSWELFHCLFTCNYLYEVLILTLSRTIWPDILHCACCLLFIANNPPPIHPPTTHSLLPPPCIILGASYCALPSHPLLWNNFKQSFNLA